MKISPKLLITLTASLIIPLYAMGKHHGEKMPVTADEQSKLTPDGVLKDLMKANKHFAKGNLPSYEVSSNLEAAAKGQYPKAYILSCVDSRVPVEHVFNQGMGDIFVGRVAGNVENEDQLGSMEFATKYAGVKLVMVLGHEACGAVKGAIGGVEDGNLTLLLEKINPAIKLASAHEHAQSNDDHVASVVSHNVEKTVSDIRARSTILSGLETEGKIKIVGAVYSLETGKVTLL